MPSSLAMRDLRISRQAPLYRWRRASGLGITFPVIPLPRGRIIELVNACAALIPGGGFQPLFISVQLTDPNAQMNHKLAEAGPGVTAVAGQSPVIACNWHGSLIITGFESIFAVGFDGNGAGQLELDVGWYDLGDIAGTNFSASA